MSNYHFDVNFDGNTNKVNLLYISYSRDENDWSSIMHSHLFSELLYIEKGKGDLLVSDNSYQIKEHDCIFLPPNSVHTEISSPDDRLEYYALGISGVMVVDDELFNPILNLGSENDRVRDLIKKIHSELRRKNFSYEMIVRGYFYILISIILRAKSNNIELKNSVHNAKGKLNLIKDYIDSHYMEDISLDDLSNMFNISKYHFVRIFKKEFSIGPMAYLEEVRIRMAKNLLATTENRITDIAVTLGFSSSSYFSQRFKIFTGVTPYDYRMMIRNNDLLL